MTLLEAGTTTARRGRQRSDRVLLPLAASVARACGVPAGEMLAEARGSRAAVAARQVAMYLAVVCLEYRQRDVATVFRRRRSVVGHNVRVIEDRRDDPAFDAWLEQLEFELTHLRPAPIPPDINVRG